MIRGTILRPAVLLFCTVLFINCNTLSTAAELKPFTTDGCSAFPDGTMKENALWIECCIRHDFSYWKGGTYEEREVADADLEKCVADLGMKELSLLMHIGVRVGGSPFYPTWYRWGYGWPYLRGYKPLTEDENGQIRARLMVVRDLLDEFIEKSGSIQE